MGKKHKILIVTSSLTIGGAETVIANLCKHIDRDIFNVTVCHLKERGETGQALLDAGYDVVGVTRSTHRAANYLSFLKLRRIINEKKIELLHSHTTYSLIDSALCKLSLPRLKLVHTFHFGNYPHYAKKYLLMEKMLWRVPDRLVAVGGEQGKVIQRTHGIPNGRIGTVWNGVEHRGPAPDPSIRECFVGNGKAIIGTIATLIEQKGITHLLDVASALKAKGKRCLFLIVGDGPLRKDLENKRHELDLDDMVFFLGWVKDAASRVLPIFDIFFQPSLWEAMSMVVLEAMAAGKPIVATDVGENAYIIEDWKTGLIVKPANVDAMVGSLETVLGNPELRNTLGAAATRKYQETFTSERMAERYEQLYLDVLKV